ncbi:MAG TPA: PIG-L deacetylase family protein [Xanthobacteraceae bacterium]|nr:PIG-L deacetylase family protein [Xanthobacteraceae bacterium]
MNVLAIGAHFDDVELGCGGALAKHKAAGDRVYVYVATDSGYRAPDQTMVRENADARREGEEAIAILGADELICGSFKTLELEFIDPLNVEILKIVHDRKIDLVYTHWIGDIHHDHHALARASLHSCRHVPRLLMYRSNWYHSPTDFRGTFFVDITPHWETKERAVRAHRSEMARTHERWISFFRHEAENAGQRMGVELAEVFELVKWLA